MPPVLSEIVHTFLIGGGRESVPVHAAFARAAGGPVVGFVLDAPDLDEARWYDLLTDAGVPDPHIVVVSPQRPPTPADLHRMTGVYVAGGLTPAYRDVLVAGGTGWLDAARAAGLVYAGFSAGAAIAATSALVGGWQLRVRGRQLQVCDPEVAEELDAVTVLPGLDLVDFTVEVHAAQWGTLHRLIQAMSLCAIDEGWAIDENTALEVRDGRLTVHGDGAATRVRRRDGYVQVSTHLAGDPVD